MFCDASPIWTFLEKLGATEDPEQARTAASGLHLIEVFPALALPSLNSCFFGRLAAPRYNPQRRKTFSLQDWREVARVTADGFQVLSLFSPADWCREAAELKTPRKADQDRLDAMLCLLIALQWRRSPRSELIMLGSLEEGYMVSPASAEARLRIGEAARRTGIRVDGARVR